MHYENMNFNYEVIAQSLSSTLQGALTAFNNLSFQQTAAQLLSGLQTIQLDALSSIDAITAVLSGVPYHPYQRLLWNYFEPDHKFKTIDDVPNHDDLPVKQCIEVLTNKSEAHKQTIFHNLTCCPDQQLDSGFAMLSGNEIIYDYDRQKQYLEFYEMVRQIPMNSITEHNAITIAKKIAAEYIKII